jgi:hypothetical protein
MRIAHHRIPPILLTGWILAWMLLHLPASAQPSPTESPKLVLKLNPLSILVSTFNIQAEKPLNERFSGQIGLQIGAPTLQIFAPNLAEPVDYLVLGLTPELRYYISFHKRAVPRGAYLGAYLRMQHVRKQYGILAYDPDYFQNRAVIVTAQINALSGGFLLGYQFLIKNRLALDIFVGPRYGSAASAITIECPGCDGDERTAARAGMEFDGLDLRGGIGIGYAF